MSNEMSSDLVEAGLMQSHINAITYPQSLDAGPPYKYRISRTWITEEPYGRLRRVQGLTPWFNTMEEARELLPKVREVYPDSHLISEEMMADIFPDDGSDPYMNPEPIPERGLVTRDHMDRRGA